MREAEHTKACDGIRYLTLDALVYINKTLISLQTPSELIGILKPNELSSSQQRPAQYRYYNQQDDMFCLTAVLMESLVRNHPFANANKRTAAVAGFIFLLINGYELTAPGHELVLLLVGLANGEYDCEDVENWLAYWSRDFDTIQLNATSSDPWIKRFAETLVFP